MTSLELAIDQDVVEGIVAYSGCIASFLLPSDAVIDLDVVLTHCIASKSCSTVHCCGQIISEVA